jgi:hypothetical protein
MGMMGVFTTQGFKDLQIAVQPGSSAFQQHSTQCTEVRSRTGYSSDKVTAQHSGAVRSTCLPHTLFLLSVSVIILATDTLPVSGQQCAKQKAFFTRSPSFAEAQQQLILW